MVLERGAWLRDVLEVQFEDLGFLWHLRSHIMRSPGHTVSDLSRIEERIEAYADLLVLAGREAVPFLRTGLQLEDRGFVTGAGYVMLQMGIPSLAEEVAGALSDAEGERLRGLKEALCFGPIDRIRSRVEALQGQDERPILAVAATEILAFHAIASITAEDVQRLVRAEDPELRRAGWRLAACLILQQGPKTYAAAMRDEEPAVRRAALEAGAWCREPGVLAIARRLAEDPRPENLEALEILAVLGGPDDLQRMAGIGASNALGPDRFRLLASYGHPGLMDYILAGLTDPDPAIAAAAAQAFTKMTGHDIESDERATLPPEDGSEPDEFEAEFLDEVALPDPEKARAHWARVRPSLESAPRICRGLDLRRRIDTEAFLEFDMESRWEMFLRARFAGSWDGSPISLEMFPQRR